MSIEQQQELKPEKRTTKQGRKSIPFTDLSIKNWRPKKKADSVLNNYHGRPKYGGMIRGHSQSWYDLPYELDREPPPSSSFHIGGKPYGEQEGYGNYAPSEEEKQETIITWDEPVKKDPGADYKPGKFKFLDEQIKNSKKS